MTHELAHELELIAYQRDEASRFFRWTFTGCAAIAAIVVVEMAPSELRKLPIDRYEMRCSCGETWACRDAHELCARAVIHMIAPEWRRKTSTPG